VTGHARRLRVAFAEMTPRLRDIVADALADETELDAEVINCSIGELEEMPEFDCDVLIGSTADVDEARYAEKLLKLVPRAKVFLISDREGRATLYELDTQKQVLGEVSPEELARAIRGAARSAGW
jgi:DNA-binding NarL/FixJ family response regulator